jgi:hypothetical protein
MIIFSRTYTRPDTETPFHNEVLDNTTYRAQLVPNYIDSGKLIQQWKEMSSDQLTMTYQAIWLSREAFDEHDNDPILSVYWTARDEYCATNNIVIGPQNFTDI